MVRLTDVTRRHGTTERPIFAVHDVSLTVHAGERLALLGKSGSGKSSVLHLIGGLDRPTSGAVEVAGRSLGGLSSRQLADYRLRMVGVVFQSFHLIATRTATQNVEMPLVFARVPALERKRRVQVALESVGLGARATHRPSQLSGGEAQRVAIARALINEPQLLLADEPTGNLDSATAASVMELLLGQVTRLGATFILVTHDEELARRSADRVVRMRDGKILQEG